MRTDKNFEQLVNIMFIAAAGIIIGLFIAALIINANQ